MTNYAPSQPKSLTGTCPYAALQSVDVWHSRRVAFPRCVRALRGHWCTPGMLKASRSLLTTTEVFMYLVQKVTPLLVAWALTMSQLHAKQPNKYPGPV